MKVLIVCSGNLSRLNPFIADQVSALNKAGITTDFFLIKGKGIRGYLKNLPRLIECLKRVEYDLVHAHYGLSGMLAVMQRRKPVVITFHGTDVDSLKNKLISLIAARLSAFNILAIGRFIRKLGVTKNYDVIACGVDLELFRVIPKEDARKELNLDNNSRVILFSSRFDNHVKNYPLAKKAFDRYRDKNANADLLELRGYSRREINLLMNAADALLVTSFTESGPLVVKEAMACNLPIVSTKVGDVPDITAGLDGIYLTTYDENDIAAKLARAVQSGKRTQSRMKALQFDNRIVAEKIKRVYEQVAPAKSARKITGKQVAR